MKPSAGALLAGLGAFGMAASVGSFTYNSTSFLLNGQPFQMLGGQMDPQRVPRELWADRIQKAKAMGLNTIFSYIYWHWLEPKQGQFNFTGNNDIAAWYQEIQKAGMHAVLRPGPYVCGERDWGGFPAWLSRISGMKVRSNNQPFLAATKAYVEAIGAQLKNASVTQGGPLLMVQVENEYGQYASDHTYTAALADIIKANFDQLRYTNDAGDQASIVNGQVPDVLAEIDGAVKSGFDARQKYVSASSGNPGPLLNGEYYTKWFSTWGPKSSFQTLEGDSSGILAVLSDVEYMVRGGHSFSLYMFHGGTNFGFGNGAVNFGSGLQPFVTSYDYGAPLDETGRPNDLYTDIRKTIAQHVYNIPAIPSSPPLQTIPQFSLQPVEGLFDVLPTPQTSTSGPISMEALEQAFSYVLYEYVATSSASGRLQPGDAPRDRVIIYVNGVKIGVIDAIYKNPPGINVSLKSGDKLWLFVENLGRVDYGPRIVDQTKGIVGSVTVGSTTLTGPWKQYPFPLEGVPSAISGNKTVSAAAGSPPVWYYGSFANNKTGLAADTLLALPGGVKGVVYVNGINLGRYWIVGPQQQIYVPGVYLKQGTNDVFVLELEPGTSARVAQGVATRTWGNRADPDCSNCS